MYIWPTNYPVANRWAIQCFNLPKQVRHQFTDPEGLIGLGWKSEPRKWNRVHATASATMAK